MLIDGWKRVMAVGLLFGAVAACTPGAWAQQHEGVRVVKNRFEPVYPELARRMRISGSVRVQLAVAPNGTVKDVKLVGGHPVLANAVMDAVKKWRYEARPQETTENLEFRFSPDE